VTNGDLKEFTWRAWTSGSDVTFMAATRVFGDRRSGRQEMLQVVAIGPDGEASSHWQHRGGGVWEAFVGA
jgi:hypothetical protein